MSRFLHLRCVNHKPYIESGEVGNHVEAVPMIRNFIVNREEKVRLAQSLIELDGYISAGNSYERTLMSFLHSHPECSYELWDEYGVEVSLYTGEDIEPFVDPVHWWYGSDQEVACGSLVEPIKLALSDWDKVTCPKCKAKGR